MLDAANAETELNENPDSGDNLVDKYKNDHSADVEEDLQKMKKELGISSQL